MVRAIQATLSQRRADRDGQTTRGDGGLHAEVPGVDGDEVADLASLEVLPHGLDGIEFRSISRQSFDRDASAGADHVVLDQATAVK